MIGETTKRSQRGFTTRMIVFIKEVRSRGEDGGLKGCISGIGILYMNIEGQSKGCVRQPQACVYAPPACRIRNARSPRWPLTRSASTSASRRRLALISPRFYFSDARSTENSAHSPVSVLRVLPGLACPILDDDITSQPRSNSHTTHICDIHGRSIIQRPI